MSRLPKKVKVHSLTGRITPELTLRAFRNVKRNRGAAGVDKVSIQMFEANLQQNLDALMRQLKDGSFQAQPLRRVYIEKSDGKQRPLGIPAVRDRVAQEVLRLLLNPIFEALFHRCSFGFRAGRSCHQAVEEVLALWRKGYQHVVDADIAGFFDAIPHRVIMDAVAAEVADGNVLRLVEKFLKAGVMEDGRFQPTEKGTPQGGVISPLLANIVLNHLDWRLEDAGYHFVRYADDFVVLAQSPQAAEEALRFVDQVVSDELGLQLSPHKTVVTSFRSGFAFLGFVISSPSVRMSPKAVRRFKDKVRAVTVRKHNLEAKVIVKLNRIIRGTANYFVAPFANSTELTRHLDRWVRMRLRAMKYKRKWRSDHFRLRCKYLHKMGLRTFADIRSTA